MLVRNSVVEVACIMLQPNSPNSGVYCTGLQRFWFFIASKPNKPSQKKLIYCYRAQATDPTVIKDAKQIVHKNTAIRQCENRCNLSLNLPHASGEIALCSLQTSDTSLVFSSVNHNCPCEIFDLEATLDFQMALSRWEVVVLEN
ncbi:hypothetical protein PIB30_037377 [Stylosanthes scabra]|uniref:Uncharacterized protein n=1 Tax=Stylosanthes scabra TaxID=79078 RepID=A0ABU6VDB3_9FABA|nr:hypothetical protein [Stylosanthes scabra]